MNKQVVGLVRDEVLDWVLLVLVSLFVGDDKLHVSRLGDGKRLRRDGVDFLINAALSVVDELFQRIDGDFPLS